MKSRLLIMVSGSVLALTACNKHDETTTNAMDSNVAMDNGAATNMAEPGPLTAQSFVNAVAASDKFEIETSALAKTATQNSGYLSFAETMVGAHSESTAKLKSIVGAMNPPLTPDDTLSAAQQGTLDSLKRASGAAFESGYKTAQIDGHQKALDLLNDYAASGDNAQLKAFASSMIPKVTAHLNMAKALK